MGAKHGAAELKEHPFFQYIDWELLYHKQLTPPFKPIVDSDESVANFDPEFTTSSLRDAGIMPWEDEEYGGHSSAGQPSRHSYVGPGGSLSSSSTMAKAGMAINKTPRPPLAGGGTSPLTSSVQENFRGFTYTGESLMVGRSQFQRGDTRLTSIQPVPQMPDHPMEGESDNDNAVDEEDVDEGEEDEYDDDMDGRRTRRQSDVEME